MCSVWPAQYLPERGAQTTRGTLKNIDIYQLAVSQPQVNHTFPFQHRGHFYINIGPLRSPIYCHYGPANLYRAPAKFISTLSNIYYPVFTGMPKIPLRWQENWNKSKNYMLTVRTSSTKYWTIFQFLTRQRQVCSPVRSYLVIILFLLENILWSVKFNFIHRSNELNRLILAFYC